MEKHNEHRGRKLPVIDIAGVEFYVDAERYVLTDTQNSNNIITGLDMLWADDHFELLFDKQRRNIKPENWDERDGDRYEYVWLRPLEVYDREGADILLGHEGQLIPDDLPVIDIEGIGFLWDGAHTRLLQKDMPYNQITKNDMQRHDEGIGFYFDTERKVVPFPHELEQLRKAGNLPAHIRFVHQQDIVRKINEQEQLKQEQTNRKGCRIR